MFTPLQTGLELQIALLVIVLVVLFGVFKVFKAVKPLIINAIIGLIILLAAGFFGVGVKITPVVVLLVAFGGAPAAILAIILGYFEIIFEPAMLVMPLF